jgi:hypothetical protein
MNRRLVTTFMLAASLGFLAGCSSVTDRIKEKPSVYTGLDPATQDKIKQGIIDIGYTEDMVYLALGAPTEKRETVTAAGKTVTWIYSTYYTRYDGDRMIGYERRVYYDPFLKTYRLYYHPAFIETYRDMKDERIRIVFKDGKATVIEQSKD